MNTTHDHSSQNSTSELVLAGIAAVIWAIAGVGAFIYGAELMPEAASAEAKSIDDLFRFMLGIATFIFLLVETCVFYFAIRYGLMRDQQDTTDGPPIHGNSTLEIVWTLIPAVIVFILTILSLQVLIDTTEAKDNELEIDVQAQQFFWQFSYPDEEFELSSNHVLIVPRNRVIRLDMNSVDVIHAFWVPEFRVKQDVMPGRATEVRFTPNQSTGLPPELANLGEQVDVLRTEVEELNTLAGEVNAAIEAEQPIEGICEGLQATAPTEETAAEEATIGGEEDLNAEDNEGQAGPPVNYAQGYDIVCTELCGANHGLMRGAVFVVEQEEYEAYLEFLRLQAQVQQLNQELGLTCGGEQLAEAGRGIFETYGCNTCHQLTDAEALAMGAGPSLNNVVADALQYGGSDDPRDYIHQSIINPNAFIVPGFPAGVMPQNFIDRIPEEELTILVEYLAMQDGEQ